MTAGERRESYRINNVSKATCTLAGNDGPIQGTVKSMSRKGFFLETDEKFEILKTYPMEIVLQGVHSRLVVDNIEGTITRQDHDGVAVDFTKPFEWLVLAPIFF